MDMQADLEVVEAVAEMVLVAQAAQAAQAIRPQHLHPKAMREVLEPRPLIMGQAVVVARVLSEAPPTDQVQQGPEVLAPVQALRALP